MEKERKVPTIRLIVDKNYFNKLVNLTDCKDDFQEEDINSNNLYNKLIKYTYLKDDGSAELRLFPFEASQLIFLLLCNIEEKEIQKNYYEELIQNRKKYIKKESD